MLNIYFSLSLKIKGKSFFLNVFCNSFSHLIFSNLRKKNVRKHSLSLIKFSHKWTACISLLTCYIIWASNYWHPTVKFFYQLQFSHGTHKNTQFSAPLINTELTLPFSFLLYLPLQFSVQISQECFKAFFFTRIENVLTLKTEIEYNQVVYAIYFKNYYHMNSQGQK